VSFRDFGETEERLYAFVRRTDGKLQLAYGVGAANTWTGDLGGPGGGTINGHTAITYRDLNKRWIYFWTTSGGKLWTYHWNGTGWSWADLGQPSGTSLTTGAPAAVTWTVNGERRQSVYVTATNGNLYERQWNGSSWVWINHGKPSGVSSVSALSATVYRIPGAPASSTSVTPADIARHIYVRRNDGKLYVRWTLNDGSTWGWADQSAGAPALGTGLTAALAYFSR